MKNSHRIQILSIVLSALFAGHSWAIPAPISGTTECQQPIIALPADIAKILKTTSTDNLANFNKLIANYEQYGKLLADGRYTLCFSGLDPNTIGNKTGTLNSLILTSKSNKPLVLYGLTWSKTTLAPNTALLTVSGSNVLLQHVTLSANTTAVKLDGSSHGIVDSTFTGTGAAGSVGILIASGSSHLIDGGSVVKNFETGVNLGNTTDDVTIADTTITDNVTAILVDGTKHTIGTGNYLDASHYGIRLLAGAQHVLITDNKFEYELKQCEAKEPLECQVYLDKSSNNAIRPLPLTTQNDSLWREGLDEKGSLIPQGNDGLVPSVAVFAPSPGTFEAYILTPENEKKIYKSISIQPFMEKHVLPQLDFSDSSSSPLLNTGLGYGILVHNLPLKMGDIIAAMFTDAQDNSSAFSAQILLKDLPYFCEARACPTTPGFTTPVIGGAGEAPGGEVAGAAPSIPTTPADDDQKSKPAQMAGGAGAAVIVGGATEGAPLTGIGAGVKGGCSLIIPR